MPRFLVFPVAVWSLCAVSAQSEASCDPSLEEEGDAASLLQVGGHARGISPRSAAAERGCPICKGCLEEMACHLGMSIQEYCEKYPETHRCDSATHPDTKHCCRDFTVECYACQKGRTYEEECVASMYRCHTWPQECFDTLKPHCERALTDALADLEDDSDFEGFSGAHCACNSIVPKPYTGPPLVVDMDADTCERHYGKEFYWTPFQEPSTFLEASLERCIQLGDDCSGVTCDETVSDGCTPKRSPKLYPVGNSLRPKEQASSTFSLRKSDCTVEEDEEDSPRRMKMKMMKGKKKMMKDKKKNKKA